MLVADTPVKPATMSLAVSLDPVLQAEAVIRALDERWFQPRSGRSWLVQLQDYAKQRIVKKSTEEAQAEMVCALQAAHHWQQLSEELKTRLSQDRKDNTALGLELDVTLGCYEEVCWQLAAQQSRTKEAEEAVRVAREEADAVQGKWQGRKACRQRLPWLMSRSFIGRPLRYERPL
ncbi:hypothetical protein ABBQ38_009784 [Trebouxia sp. C0009 RCD-2024]